MLQGRLSWKHHAGTGLCMSQCKAHGAQLGSGLVTHTCQELPSCNAHSELVCSAVLHSPVTSSPQTPHLTLTDPHSEGSALPAQSCRAAACAAVPQHQGTRHQDGPRAQPHHGAALTGTGWGLATTTRGTEEVCNIPIRLPLRGPMEPRKASRSY